MTLQEFMDSRGYSKETGANKGNCPFHDDWTNSAYINTNSVYCFSCARLYTLADFARVFHVHLDYVNEASPQLQAIQSLTAEERVLFEYPFAREREEMEKSLCM